MKPEELKKYFENYQLATQNFNKNSIKNSLVKYFSENFMISCSIKLK